MGRQQLGQLAVEALDVAEAAAENDRLRVDQVDDVGQGPGEPPDVALHCRLGGRLAGGGARGDLVSRDGLLSLAAAARTAIVARQARAREEGLDAAAATAVAGVARALAVFRPGQGVVTPLPGDGVGPGDRPAVDHQAAADAGA